MTTIMAIAQARPRNDAHIPTKAEPSSTTSDSRTTNASTPRQWAPCRKLAVNEDVFDLRGSLIRTRRQRAPPWLEAKAGKPRGRLPVDFPKLRVPVNPGLISDVELVFRAVDETDAEVSFVQPAVQIEVAYDQSYAIMADGTLMGWGNLADVSPGDMASAPPVSVPQELTGFPPVIEVGASGREVCALTETGDLHCANRPALVPELVSSAILSFSVGEAHSCMVGFDGAVRCWGDNIGWSIDSTATASYPRSSPAVANSELLPAAIDVAVGVNTTCARNAAGQVLCRGSNYDGVVLPDQQDVWTAVPHFVRPIGTTEFATLTMGPGSVCAWTPTDLQVSCWGQVTQDESPGFAGVITWSEAEEPILALTDNGVCQIQGWGEVTCGYVAPLTGITQVTDAVGISTSGAHGCVLTKTGAVWCAGENAFGQLGNGEFGAPSFDAVQVQF